MLDLDAWDMHEMMNTMMSWMSTMTKGSGKGTSQDLVQEEPSDEPPAARRRLGTPPRKPRTTGILAEASAASSGVAAAEMPCASAASTSDSDTPSWCEVAAAVEDAGRECPP